MTTPTRDERIEAIVAPYAELAPDRIEQLVALTPDQLRVALDELVSKRSPYNVLRTLPTYRERPLGSLLGRLLRWHRGSGQLDGYMMAKWDADRFPAVARLRYRDLGLEAYEDLFDVLDTTALLLLGGRSTAADAWRRTGLFGGAR